MLVSLFLVKHIQKITYLTKNAHIKSIGKCAKYVRTAIEAGGLSTNGHPISAYQYIDFLPKIGFREINKITGIGHWFSDERPRHRTNALSFLS